jgi:hypothetical protein
MLYSVTASHYDCNIKSLMLDYTIESLLLNNIDMCLISISFNNEEHYLNNKNKIDELSEKYKDKIKVYIQLKKYFQFQHLEFLCQEMSSFVNTNDKILFCDDDDIILELPKIDGYEVISGIHFLSGFEENDKTGFSNYIQIKELINSENVKFWNTVNDFSGYICSYEIFSNFFKMNKFNFNNSSKLEMMSHQLIDTKFMTYLDSFNVCKESKPFVYHRIWSTQDRQMQQWLQNFNEVDEFILLKNKNTDKSSFIKIDKLKNDVEENLKKIKEIINKRTLGYSDKIKTIESNNNKYDYLKKGAMIGLACFIIGIYAKYKK